MDVYAIGMMMAEMLAGEPILRCTAVEACLAQLDPKRIELPERVASSGLGAVIRRATEKDLELRYGNAAEMLAALRRIGPGASTAPPPRAQDTAELAPSRDSLSPTELMPNPELVLGPLLAAPPSAPPVSQTLTTRPPAALPAVAPRESALGWLGAAAALLILAVAATAIAIYLVRTAGN